MREKRMDGIVLYCIVDILHCIMDILHCIVDILHCIVDILHCTCTPYTLYTHAALLHCTPYTRSIHTALIHCIQVVHLLQQCECAPREVW
jgi:hypothetical protein